MIPCKDCISFAVCNSHDDKITCSLLYKYFIEKDIPPQLVKLEKIESLFNRKYDSWYFGSSGTLDSPNMTINWSKFPYELKGY